VIKHPIKHPSKSGAVAALGLVILNAVFIFRLLDHVVLTALVVFSVLLCLIVLVFTLYSLTKKATDLQISANNLEINGRFIQANDIKMIMIKGYFNPVIGILPHGKKIVPIQMAFRFAKDEDKGITDLRNWAGNNQVKMGYRYFQSWI